MEQKRAVEHYKEHEIVCVAKPESSGWHYSISVITHKGDNSLVHSEQSAESFKTDTAALHAGAKRARYVIDEMRET